MRGSMANNSQNHNVGPAIGPTVRDRSPDAPMGRSGCCGGFLRLGTRKRGKRIVPATRMHDGSASSSRVWATNGTPQSGTGNQYASLSPSLLAPPSSPASFQNSAVQSSAQSPSTYSVSLAVPSATSQIPLETTATMFQMGPYAHETALVSPPVFSTFTTAPSTAPFTPPPELATHVTTPSSPDVPFAQLLTNSFGTKGPVRQQPPQAYSASPFASPDIFAADDLQAAYQLYPGSPLAHLLSPPSGTGQSTPFPELELSSQSSLFPDLENPVQAVATMFLPGSPLLALEPAATMESLLLSQALNPCSFQEFGLEEKQSSNSSFVLEQGDDDTPKPEATADISSGRHSNDENKRFYDYTLDTVTPSACKNTQNSLDSERELTTDRVRGHATDIGDQEIGLFPLLAVDYRSSSGASDLVDWNHNHKTASCEAKDSSSPKTSGLVHRGNEDEEIADNRESKPAEDTLRNCHQGIDDTVVSGSLSDKQEAAETSTYKESLTPEIRVQDDTEPSRRSRNSLPRIGNLINTPHGEDSADSDRSTHVCAESSWSTSDTGVPQQQNFTGQKLDEQSVCGGQNRKDCCGRCDELETRCDELTIALKQATQKLAGIEVKERVAVYREQQLKALVHWLASGAKVHQKCFDGMSKQLSEFRGANSEQESGESNLVGSFSGTCKGPDEAQCIACSLVILETKIKTVVEENISTGPAGVRSENSFAISILSGDRCYSGQGSSSG